MLDEPQGGLGRHTVASATSHSALYALILIRSPSLLPLPLPSPFSPFACLPNLFHSGNPLRCGAGWEANYLERGWSELSASGLAERDKQVKAEEKKKKKAEAKNQSRALGNSSKGNKGKKGKKEEADAGADDEHELKTAHARDKATSGSPRRGRPSSSTAARAPPKRGSSGVASAPRRSKKPRSGSRSPQRTTSSSGPASTMTLPTAPARAAAPAPASAFVCAPAPASAFVPSSNRHAPLTVPSWHAHVVNAAAAAAAATFRHESPGPYARVVTLPSLGHFPAADAHAYAFAQPPPHMPGMY